MARAALLLLAALIAQPASQEKKESKPVAINILVIEADNKSDAFDERLKALALRKAFRGFKAAKVLDELNTNVEEGSSVSLEIMKQSGEARLLKVTVKDVQPNGTVVLHVNIEALKFDADITHPKNADGTLGQLVVGKDMPGDKALFLAVKPKI